MFWTKRLKETEADADNSWVLSYGDLMSLLLVIFVMIAAMSELHAGQRFGKMRDGVRQAFGFSRAATADLGGARAGRRPTLLERLEQGGFRRQSTASLIGPDAEKLAACEVLVGDQTVTLRMNERDLFAASSTAIEPSGAKALRQIAEYLAEGMSRIEVTSHTGPGVLTGAVPFRDGMDLSYARGRAVVDVLSEKVAPERMSVTARTEREPSAETPAREATSKPAEMRKRVDGGHCIEIVVHAAPAAGANR